MAFLIKHKMSKTYNNTSKENVYCRKMNTMFDTRKVIFSHLDINTEIHEENNKSTKSCKLYNEKVLQCIKNGLFLRLHYGNEYLFKTHATIINTLLYVCH